ncbi:MAG: pyridoxamine 5'-phosphate oxidase family protein [Pseudomonadales bacterium]|jgi:nitroimidazol reductase NimA-like FMN-containing flavoprotein (pyridoxamine 5'-phosphate oxidase superfamily)
MPSRRELIQLTDEERRDYLNAAKTLIIVSNGKNGYPHPMPMWFYVDDAGNFYCTTFRKSQKVLNFQRDPRASLLVESGEEYAELKSVLAYATCEVIDDYDTVRETLVKINTKGRDVDEAQVAQLLEAVGKTAEKRVALKFTPVEVISWDHAKLGGSY